MPTYVYHCNNCGKHIEVKQHFTDEPLTVCPYCHQPALQKVYQVAYVHYRGNGFYQTDKNKGMASVP